MQFTWNKADDPSQDQHYFDDRLCLECKEWFSVNPDSGIDRCQECQQAWEMRGEDE